VTEKTAKRAEPHAEAKAEAEETEAPVVAVPTGVGNASDPRSRADEDATVGEWVDVIAGEYQGRYGYYVEPATLGPDGLPETVFVRTRDKDNLLIEVAYSDIHPSERTGGR
jgi:hypothetical protein